MQNTTIYLKLERDVAVGQDEVYIKDVGELYCKDKEVLAKAKSLWLCSFHSSCQKRIFLNVLEIVEKLEALGTGITVESVGECDVIVERLPDKPPSKLWEFAKIAFVVLISFFGTAFTIMAFHNDIAIRQLFDGIYVQIMGEESPGFTALEIAYSLGLAIGIIVFFNHFGKKKINDGPTPIEVEMKMYENDITTTLIETERRQK